MQSRESNLLRLTWGCVEWQLRHRIKYEKQIYRLTAAIGAITIIYVKNSGNSVALQILSIFPRFSLYFTAQ